MYFAVAGLFVQGGHSYLLFSQKHDRKWSISDHAAVSTRTHLLYFICHFLGAVGWFIGSYLLFYNSGFRYIFYISAAAALFEVLQATFPSKIGRIRSLHSIFAYLMWVSCMVTILLGIIALPLNNWQRVAAAMCLVPITAMFIYMHLRRERIYHLQYATIYFFFLGMLVFNT